MTLDVWLNKRQEVENWLFNYSIRENAMWQKLGSILKIGETASVFILDHRKRLFVMGSTGLPTVLYHPYRFSPVDSSEPSSPKQKNTVIEGDCIFQLRSKSFGLR
ncbi:hypothetical protein KQI42_03835 [Tissierella sp. MSJ-40]|uniref:Uncharacterized protein n=1 Tax=Tissierella simiarum TaxID=2841534 RepID=A0ABS6E2S5_9FIRM|nr:hypothetical protein [Tissierella simiarum]MBU5437126.1 hypothetical protein [Tissierella simiarum]